VIPALVVIVAHVSVTAGTTQALQSVAVAGAAVDPAGGLTRKADARGAARTPGMSFDKNMMMSYKVKNS